MRRLRTFGWIPDLPDYRDRKYASASVRTRLPNVVSMADKMPPVYDQLDLGCCTAAAVTAAYIYADVTLNNAEVWNPSMLFTYYTTRLIEKSVDFDFGAQIRNAIKSAVEYGITCEEKAPFRPEKFRDLPPPDAFGFAAQHQVERYTRVDIRLLPMLSCLASRVPFVFGAMLYENFNDVGSDGIVSMPAGEALGGHAMVCVGYDYGAKTFTVRNSWGSSWGDKGYCRFPFDYLTNPDLTADAWVITAAER